MSLLQFKALADETRLRLLHVLLHYELSVNELVRILGMGQSRISRHLKILTEAGLARARRDGLWVFYSAPGGGEDSQFIEAVKPFFPQNNTMKADLQMAARMLEERANRARQFFNSIADNWDDLNREILGDFDLPGHVAAIMPRCQTAVDLGCGTGAVLAAMRARSEFVIGVDNSSAMLERCRARLTREEVPEEAFSLRIGEISHLPLADHEADFASINLVLHHLPQPDAAFAEIRRILRPRSTVVATEFLRHKDETMRARYGDYWLGFDKGKIEEFFEAAGFYVCGADTYPVRRDLGLLIVTAYLER